MTHMKIFEEAVSVLLAARSLLDEFNSLACLDADMEVREMERHEVGVERIARLYPYPVGYNFGSHDLVFDVYLWFLSARCEAQTFRCCLRNSDLCRELDDAKVKSSNVGGLDDVEAISHVNHRWQDGWIRCREVRHRHELDSTSAKIY